jgi:hypothetical protein
MKIQSFIPDIGVRKTEPGMYYPDEKASQFIQLLEDDPKFEIYVKNSRKACGIPKDGIEANPLITKAGDLVAYIHELLNGSDMVNGQGQKINSKTLDKETRKIVGNYQLGFAWIPSIAFFVVHNYLFPPLPVPEIHILTRDEVKNFDKTPYCRKHTTFIEVKNYVNVTQLINWINRYYPNPKFNYRGFIHTPIPKRIQMLNVKRRIYELRNSKPKPIPFEKISQFVSEEFGLEKVLYENDVKQIYHRYTDFLKKLSVKKKK